MLIDLILDRRAGDEYSAREMYYYLMDDVFDFYRDIAKVMDEGTEEDVKKALCDYVMSEGYNPDICNYINSVNWL